MLNDISGFGVQVQIVASVTFPAGITITQFADDADPLDFTAIDIADKAMGVNGDLIKWSKANPLPMTLNVIASSTDDVNLSVLAEANRVGQGKNSAQDVVTATVIYPNGNVIVLSQGFINNAVFGQSIASAGRQKTKPYQFTFQNKVETFAQPNIETILGL